MFALLRYAYNAYIESYNGLIYTDIIGAYVLLSLYCILYCMPHTINTLLLYSNSRYDSLGMPRP